MEEYKIILNMKDKILDVFKKSIKDEKYDIVAEDENILFIKKSKNDLTKAQVLRILSIAKLQKSKEILFVDITSAVNYLINIPEEKIKNDGKFSWMIRQAFLKARLFESGNNI